MRQADATYERERAHDSESRQADAAYEAEIRSRIEQPRASLAQVAAEYDHARETLRNQDRERDLMRQAREAADHRAHQPRRTPEAQADIAAARAAPTEAERRQDMIEQARAQGGDREAEAVADALDRDQAITDLAHQPNRTLDGLLSNAALADTPAVREMGGPGRFFASALAEEPCSCGAGAHITRSMHHESCPIYRPADPDVGRASNGCKACDSLGWEIDNGKAIILRGPEAERYRALQDAARKAQASAATARADGAALLQLFQAFCAGLAPGKDG